MTQLRELIENSRQVSLYTICSERYYDNQKGWSNFVGTERLFEEVADLVIDCVGGQSNTKEQIRRNIERYPSALIRKNSWMTERIIFTISKHDSSIRCQYVAGQDYSAEIKEVRKHLKS